MPDGNLSTLSLRERKKVKTRNLIQEHALRLFLEQGYEETTVEQVAQAADVSLSTIFRYFPTKEDLVLRDAFDPVFLKTFRKQPAKLSLIRALRVAFREAFAQISTDEMLEREELMFKVPELRVRMLDEFASSFKFLVEMMAERVGRSPDDITLQSLAGAVIGIVISVWFNQMADIKNFVMLLDKGLEQLENGFSL